VGSSVARHQLVGDAAQPAQVDDVGVEQQLPVGPEGEAHEQEGEVGVLGPAAAPIRQAAAPIRQPAAPIRQPVAPIRQPVAPIGQAVEQQGEVAHGLGVELRQTPAQLRAPERGDGDLLEEDAACALGRHLEVEDVERAGDGALRVEHVELRHQRSPHLVDDLIDGGDEEGLLRVEVVVHQTCGQSRLRRDPLHGRSREAMPHQRGAQPVDDLPPPRLGETRATHR